MELSFLDSGYEQQYDEFLLKSSKTLFFASNKYRQVLKQHLNCKDYYLLALDNSEIVGVLPCFIKENNQYGNVINSLPYYGSNGAIIEHNNDYTVKDLLLDEFKNLCNKYNCVASTLITSPFETDLSYYQNASHDYVDSRRGLVSHLPKYETDLEQTLMAMFNSAQRNAIRKARKFNVNVYIDNSESSIDFLYRTHLDNMMQVGGKPKERIFFEMIYKQLQPDVDYDIYIAEQEGVKVSALLVFYFNKTVEYFTPVIVNEYRTYQPLCLIILEAMKNATIKRFEYFNWGGTGATQTGVYNFKKAFGSTEYYYYYYTNLYDKSLLSLSNEIILSEYENFYVFPFQN